MIEDGLGNFYSLPKKMESIAKKVTTFLWSIYIITLDFRTIKKSLSTTILYISSHRNLLISRDMPLKNLLCVIGLRLLGILRIASAHDGE